MGFPVNQRWGGSRLTDLVRDSPGVAPGLLENRPRTGVNVTDADMEALPVTRHDWRQVPLGVRSPAQGGAAIRRC